MSKTIENLKTGNYKVVDNQGVSVTIHFLECLEKEFADLEAKLAEKEKENEQLKKFDDLNKTFFDLFRTAFKEPDKVDDLFNTLKTIQEKQDQDKISFCIEKLEKVKEDVKNVHIEDTQYDCYCFQETTRDNCVEIIISKIEELKKGVSS